MTKLMTKDELIAKIEETTGLALAEIGAGMLAGGFDVEYDLKTATGFSVGHVTLYPAKGKGWRIAGTSADLFSSLSKIN